MNNSRPLHGRITAERHLKQGEKRREREAKMTFPLKRALIIPHVIQEQGAIKTLYSQNVILLTTDLLSSLRFGSDFN